MKRMHYGEDKPLGWSYDFRRGEPHERRDFKWGIFGGTLILPPALDDSGLAGYHFQEWFFRIPVLAVIIVLCRIRADSRLADEMLRNWSD